MSAPTRPWRAPAGAVVGFLLAFAAVHFALPDTRAAAPVAQRVGFETARAAAQDPALRSLRPAPAVETTTRAEALDASAAAVAPADTAAALGTFLCGTVKDSDGELVTSGWISTQLAHGERLNTAPDGRGRYTLGPLPPGPRHVRAWTSHAHPRDLALDLAADAGFVRCDLELERMQRIVVRVVTSTGAPTWELLAGSARGHALPVATREDPGATYAGVSGYTNEQVGIGSFWGPEFAAMAQRGGGMIGMVDLHEPPPAWLLLVSSNQVLAKQPIDLATEEVTFVLDPEDFVVPSCAARGRVIDAVTGAPLAALVALRSGGLLNWQSLETAADGTFTLEDAPPGEVLLMVSAPERASVQRRLTLEAGAVFEVGDIAMNFAVSIAGTVRRASGETPAAVIEWVRLDPPIGHVTTPGGNRKESALDGSFMITDLEPGSYALRSPGLAARSPSPYDPSRMAPPVRVNTVAGSVEGVELVLEETTAITLVTGEVGEPWPTATALDAAGLPLRRVSPGRWGSETPLQLPHGSYTLRIERDGVVLEDRALTVGSEPQRIELDFD